MWYRRLGDDEVIGKAHHCAIIGPFSAAASINLDEWVEMNDVNIPIVTNQIARAGEWPHGMTVKEAKFHFSKGYEFFESREEPPIFEKFQLLGEVFNGQS